jgi:hypothetical protein
LEIRSESTIGHSREKVFCGYRDKLPEIAAYITDIREIRVLSRAEEGASVRLHNEWVSDRDVPSIAKKFLKPEQLQWDDFAVWHSDEWFCEWEIKTRAFRDAVKCSGRNTFVEVGEGSTRVVLTGELQIHLKEIPGVPRLLAGRLRPTIEKFIVSLITPNLRKVNESLQQYLDGVGS